MFTHTHRYAAATINSDVTISTRSKVGKDKEIGQDCSCWTH